MNTGWSRQRRMRLIQARNTTSKSFDNDTLIAIYCALSDERIDYSVRKWDIIRTGSLFFLGVLAVVGGLLTHGSVPWEAYAAASVGLMVTAGTLWWWVRSSVSREARLQYSVEFSMYQIEKLLGLHSEIEPQDAWLGGTPFIYEKKHRDATYGTGLTSVPDDLDTWLAAKTAKHSFLKQIDILFGSLLIICVAIVGALMTVAFIH